MCNRNALTQMSFRYSADRTSWFSGSLGRYAILACSWGLEQLEEVGPMIRRSRTRKREEGWKQRADGPAGNDKAPTESGPTLQRACSSVRTRMEESQCGASCQHRKHSGESSWKNAPRCRFIFQSCKAWRESGEAASLHDRPCEGSKTITMIGYSRCSSTSNLGCGGVGSLDI